MQTHPAKGNLRHALMFFFILGPLVHPYMAFYKFGTWMVNIGLKVNEMKSSIQI
jgi:hypothetical protein